MKNKVSLIGIILGVIIGLLISGGVFFVFYRTKINWTREVSTGELLSFGLGTVITILLFYIGKKLSNKVDLREHFIQELSSIETVAMNIETLIKQSLLDKNFDKDKFSTLLQGYLKLIGNKIMYIKDKSINTDENKKNLEESFYKLRNDITESIRNTKFIVSNEYYQLFVRAYGDFIVQVVNYKGTLIK